MDFVNNSIIQSTNSITNNGKNVDSITATDLLRQNPLQSSSSSSNQIFKSLDFKDRNEKAVVSSDALMIPSNDVTSVLSNEPTANILSSNFLMPSEEFNKKSTNKKRRRSFDEDIEDQSPIVFLKSGIFLKSGNNTDLLVSESPLLPNDKKSIADKLDVTLSVDDSRQSG